MFSESENLGTFISTPWKDHHINLLASSSKLWGTTRGNAIDYGDLIHEMMSLIKTKDDINEVIDQYINQGILDDKEIEKITKTIITALFIIATISPPVPSSSSESTDSTLMK